MANLDRHAQILKNKIFQIKNNQITKKNKQTDGPAIVRINLFVRSIMTISDIKMVSASLFPHQHQPTNFVFLSFVFGSLWF